METIKNFNIKRLLLMLQKDIFDSLKYVISIAENGFGTGYPGLEAVANTLKYSLVPLFWVVTYFKLKEKEV